VRDHRVLRDEVRDEHALIVQIRGLGLVVLTGCAHAGVINTIRAAQRITGIDRIALVAGGFHLGFPTTPPENIDKTIQALEMVDPGLLVPMHCTGLIAASEMARRLPSAFAQSSVGTTISLTAVTEPAAKMKPWG
jgi:7,8-dihydropterin-6-yl-methyl-4-(beta-D-ribofuranosyl)aminobenzene 5'-phosphate synthase